MQKSQSVFNPLKSIFLTEDQFMKLDLPEKKPFLYPWLTEQSIVMITGTRGIGKTWFALSVLDAVTSGKDLGKWTCGAPVPCLYLDGEMVAQDLKNRMKYFGKSKRITPIILYSDAYAHSIGLPKSCLTDPLWREQMKEMLLASGIKLWVADNIASMTPGIDENATKEWGPINQWLLDLRFAGVSTMLLHHEGKDGKQRGASSKEDNIDVSISLKRLHGYQAVDGAKFLVKFTKHRIGNQDIELIRDSEFSLSQNGNGPCATQKVSYSKKETVISLIEQGFSQTSIVSQTGITKGYVSKLWAERNRKPKQKVGN